MMSFNIIEGVFFFRILSLGCFFFGSLNEVVRYYCSYQREISKANISFFFFCMAGSSFGSSRLSLLGIVLVLSLEEVLMFQHNCICCD